ncbi:DUF6985 domain-containing protein [Flavilitoribacter nigricans]|uniref:DUF6985 domain-containing protein n=1 Tax=Flavilitoribacter nigricans (strain ATCC 23147 / DSM 23189 / NBRC 102662 / NCIMB 1420 / SS-2) TaxID=1122177 RepID=A0A2D0MWI7_FLAN2|nr:ankyrin repeat domain-containing protein [Flavilitoribacter nigricans]PHN00567.1 hypothetical protein CRP01_41565 [Flavilitoribacter nigricans DSM 23189 = NBRC 102662]
MKENKETYQFDGDWEFNLRLPEFSKIHSDYWFRNRRRNELLQILENGYVPFQIFDERTYEPEPTEPQKNSIHYLIENENSLVESIFRIFKDQINKQYVEWCGEDDWIPELNTYEDLGKLARINSIQVLSKNKSHISYMRIDFEYKGDEEHGIAIILHKDQLIGFSGIGDMGYECIYKDLGLDEKKVFEEMLENRHIGENIVHKPLQKYGKFKPWQLNSTSDYFGKLLRERKNEKIIEEIESNQWDINLRFPGLNKNLVDKAAYSNNVEILDYLIVKGGDFSNSILQCINYGFYHPESIKFLVQKGASIDSCGYWGKTPLCYALENFIRATVRKEDYRDRDEKRYEQALKEYETNKEKIIFYLELGANPNNLDEEKKTYKDIANRSWAEHIIKKYKIHEQIEELIFPERTKKNKWKFWKRNEN